jgi:hypothetical protein
VGVRVLWVADKSHLGVEEFLESPAYTMQIGYVCMYLVSYPVKLGIFR